MANLENNQNFHNLGPRALGPIGPIVQGPCFVRGHLQHMALNNDLVRSLRSRTAQPRPERKRFAFTCSFSPKKLAFGFHNWCELF